MQASDCGVTTYDRNLDRALPPTMNRETVGAAKTAISPELLRLHTPFVSRLPAEKRGNAPTSATGQYPKRLSHSFEDKKTNTTRSEIRVGGVEIVLSVPRSRAGLQAAWQNRLRDSESFYFKGF